MGSQDWNEPAAGLLAARVIDEVAAEGPLTVAELASRLVAPQQHVARIVNRLVTHLAYLATTGSGTVVLTAKVNHLDDRTWRAEVSQAFSVDDA